MSSPKFLLRTTPLMIAILICDTLFAANDQCKIDPEKSLIIRDLSIIGSPLIGNQVWTFDKMLQGLGVKEVQSSAFISQWLKEWEQTTVLNGFTIDRRMTAPLQALWDGSAQIPNLDWKKSPFVLSAIVPRFDLVPTHNDPFGQLRFIFSTLDRKTLEVLPMGIIFEFRLPEVETTGDQVDSREYWIDQFIALSCVQSSDDYRNRLNQIVSYVLNHRGNQSNFLQLRTNEALFAPIWQLREFRLQGSTLKMAALPETPDVSFESERSDQIGNYLMDNRENILRKNFTMSSRFLSGVANAIDESSKWLFSNKVDNDVRRLTSLNTCNGCHAGETMTRFFHVDHQNAAVAAKISNFLQHDIQVRKQLLESRHSQRDFDQNLNQRRNVH